MHITLYPLAVSTDETAAKKFWTHSAMMRRAYPQSELTMLPIEYADDANNFTSIWANIDAADIVVVLLSGELLSALDDFVDQQTGINRILDALEAKREQKEYRLIPIRVRECSWNEDGSSFQKLVALPRSGAPIAERSNQDSVWSEVIGEMRAVFKDVQAATLLPVSVPQAATPTTIITPAYCPRCSATINLNSRHCVSCGSQVK